MGKLIAEITNDQRVLKVPNGTRPLIRQCCRAVLKEEGIRDDCEVSVTIVDNEAIKELNSRLRGIDRETDVLSFPLGENGEYDIDYSNGALLLGDIVISLQKAFEQAEEYGHSPVREVAFLTVHSMLHLLGYDHIAEGDRAVMREKEEKILNAMGITRE